MVMGILYPHSTRPSIRRGIGAWRAIIPPPNGFRIRYPWQDGLFDGTIVEKQSARPYLGTEKRVDDDNR
jgi:hypothetical protein